LDLLQRGLERDVSERNHADPRETGPRGEARVELGRDEVGTEVVREGQRNAFTPADGLKIVVEDRDVHRTGLGIEDEDRWQRGVPFIYCREG